MPYVNVILPVPVQGAFTYALPAGMPPEEVRVGSRVLVPFGARHFYTGIVQATEVPRPEGMKAKEIISVLDPAPIIRHPQLRFWNWISTYYLCTLGEVFKAALPAGLKVESETVVEVNPDLDGQLPADLGEAELKVLTYLREQGKQPTSAKIGRAHV